MNTYIYLYDSEESKTIVISEKMLKYIKKYYNGITFLDCKTGVNNTVNFDDCFNCKDIIINF